MKSIQILSCLLFASFLTSCASYFLKKDCEKTNWFEYGQNLAIKGQFIEQDSFIKECKKIDAQISHSQLDIGYKKGREKYCSPEQIFLFGKTGEPIDYNFCDGIPKYTIDQKYQAGLKEFCTPTTGFEYGASGKIYKNVCKDKAEAAFLPDYKKGRAKYLKSQISENVKVISDNESEVQKLNNDKNFEYRKMAFLPNSKVWVQKQQINPSTGKIEMMNVQEDDQNVVSERDRINSSINDIDSKIKSLTNQNSNLKSKNSSMRQELVTLE